VTEPWVVCSARPDRRQVALTFDDGPSGSTEAVLDVLDAHGARGTFFVVGEWVERLPDVVLATATRGHELGNHTWTHFNGREVVDTELWRDQIRRTSDAVQRIAGHAPRFFRPPFGAVPGRFARVAAACGLEATVLWTVQSVDYESAVDDARIEADVIAEVHPGAIVLHHDGDVRNDLNTGTPQAGTVRALPRILERLAADGYRFVTVSELLAA
jgi:peptidoglycan/xylan/chitin deacetylase (PgdA/CDA1 family)